MISKEIKEKIKSGETVIGTFVKLGSPTVVEILGTSGLDFIIVDTEHAPCDQMQLENIIRASDYVNLPVIVRVPVAEDSTIVKALDLGASGIQLPGLETVEAVSQAIKTTKYAPKGRRGLSFTQRSAKYGKVDKDEYMSYSNEYLINVVHIENKLMAENIEKICALTGIDVIFIGPMDLSQSFGNPGNPSLPEIQATILNVIKVCNEYNRACGIFANTPDEVKKYKELGVRYFAFDSDIGFLLKGVNSVISSIK